MIETYDPVRSRHSLVLALQDTFAELAFIDALEADEAPAAALRESAAIDILRPMSSRIELKFERELMDMVARNLFLDEEAADRNREDSILELVNVMAGRFLTDYFGANADIKLELPRILYDQAEKDGEVICAAYLDAEGLPMEASLKSVRYKY